MTEYHDALTREIVALFKRDPTPSERALIADAVFYREAAEAAQELARRAVILDDGEGHARAVRSAAAASRAHSAALSGLRIVGAQQRGSAAARRELIAREGYEPTAADGQAGKRDWSELLN